MIPAPTLQSSPVPVLERICFVVEGTAAMFPFWQDIRTYCLDPILKDLESRTSSVSEPQVELALVICGSATPWSQCPIERSGWTQNLHVFSQWLDAIQPSEGAPVPQPLLAEALSEAVYLLQTAARTCQPGSQQGPTHNRVIVCVASEPSRLYVPWPYPADCKVMDGLASHFEICQALKNHGADFNFVAGQVQGNKVLHQRLIRAFALAHDMRNMNEVKACLVDISPDVMCCISPKWPKAKASIQSAAPPTHAPVKQVQNSSEGLSKTSQSAATELSASAHITVQLPQGSAPRHTTPGAHFGGAAPGTQGQAQHSALGVPPLPTPQGYMQPSQGAPAAAGQPQRQRTPIWKGTMLLGEKLSKGPTRKLWTCTAVIDHSHHIPPGLGSNWPQNLVINKLTNRADLNHLVKDRGRGLQRGVLNIIELEETGKALALEMDKKKMGALVDLGTLNGVPANLIVLTVPGQDSKGIQAGVPAGSQGAMPHCVFMIITTTKD